MSANMVKTVGVTRQQKRLPFRRQRERAWWLLFAACAVAALWAIAQVLAWPILVRAALAVAAAAVGLIVPEVRARRAVAQRQEQLVARVEVHGRDSPLPRVREVSDAQFRVHASRIDVPYIMRDKQAEVDRALLARQPLLIVGHSMAGKTRLAASRVRALFPGATLLAPLPGAALRELVDNRLDLADTIVWLDDLERFLTGENWLDPGLLGTLVTNEAEVVATMRWHALEVYRPSDEARPPQWETISRFTRVDLKRLLSAEESRVVDANVADSNVRAAIHRYGLAEYLGAGPDAVDKFDSGESECPVGAALVRAAIDWRRAGLARLVKRGDLREAIPIYLRDRPEVPVDATSVADGLQWAMKKVNETVSLLMPNYSAGNENVEGGNQDEDRALFEVFDYLVDVLTERAASEDRVQRDKALIPIDMYRLVVEAASRADLADVQMAARAQLTFFDRTEELAELTSWLASPLGSSPSLGFLCGLGGIGKTAILRRLQQLGDPKTRQLIAGAPAQLLLNVPRFDAVIAARGLSEMELIDVLFREAGVPQPALDYTVHDSARRMLLGGALHFVQKPMIIAIDGLDEAREPEQAMHLLLDLYRGDRDIQLRILVTTRQRPPEIPGIVRIFEVGAGTRQDIAEFARRRLVAEKGSLSDEETRQMAEIIADHADGLFLVAAMLCANVSYGSLPSDPATFAQRWAELQSAGPGERGEASIRASLERQLYALGERMPDALVLLTALARGPTRGMTADECLAAASRLGNRPYTQDDLDRLSERSFVGRPRDGRYMLHDLVRAFVLDYHDGGAGTAPPPREAQQQPDSP
jgi:hypothetical protein